MKRPWQVWLIFTLSLAVVLTAMGWISLTALRSEEAEALGQARSDYEEAVRLALWRMDAHLANIVSQETARPYFTYSSFYPAEQSYAAMCNTINRDDGEFLMPSPLLTDTPPHVLLHFQFADDGTATSPQIPDAKLAALIEAKYLPAEKIEQHQVRLQQFQASFSCGELVGRLPQPEAVSDPHDPASDKVGAVLLANARNWSGGEQWDNNGMRLNPAAQSGRGQAEYQVRRQSLEAQMAQQAANPPGGIFNSTKVQSALQDLQVGPMKPCWVKDELFLLRRISLAGTKYVQGVWLNWQWIHDELLDGPKTEVGPEPISVRELFPRAELQMAAEVAPSDEAAQNRLLAALPVRFETGAVVVAQIDPLSPTRITLYIAWACVLLAALAVGALLFGVVQLSERRAAFVSSVTHELRTPLTTFRMYSEMLAGGMVPEEQQRKEYLNTLRSESGRLSHLVENVLGYAKLERGRPSRRVQAVPLGSLLDQTTARLRERAEHAGLEFQVENKTQSDPRVLCDPTVVEQILFNLVDNACKYAGNSSPPLLRMEVETDGGRVLLRLLDHGPGVAADVRKRLFRPFSKSAKDAAHSAPGVGLGLALSRRLARAMGGDLRYLHGNPDGAVFELRLETAE